ncbi:PEP-CTERM sorting domain-containing protein [Aeoliella sp. SH292]|uniref:PEP-CTERM sorting domain-containing protein n=1 Tax=Aeoliella sp. SH292 TaxID=3454464 RepID=UPI003F965FDA
MMRSRILTCSVAVMGTMALLLLAANATANILVNPGFETDAALGAAPNTAVTGWGPIGAAFTASANGLPVRSGIGSLQLVSANGGFTVPTARQEFPVNPGDIVNLQGYHLTENSLPSDATFHLFKIVWEDSSGTELNPIAGDPNLIGGLLFNTNPGVESTPFLNSASGVGVWNFSEAQGTAPAGAASVVLLGGLLVDQSAATVFVDDLTATITRVPEPSAIALAGLCLLGAGFMARCRK